jgi:hypothetical protein
MTRSSVYRARWEPPERDPGGGWRRSRFCHLPWPRPGHEAPCGRPICPVCGEAPIQCEELQPEPMEKER